MPIDTKSIEHELQRMKTDLAKRRFMHRKRNTAFGFLLLIVILLVSLTLLSYYFVYEYTALRDKLRSTQYLHEDKSKEATNYAEQLRKLKEDIKIKSDALSISKIRESELANQLRKIENNLKQTKKQLAECKDKKELTTAEVEESKTDAQYYLSQYNKKVLEYNLLVTEFEKSEKERKELNSKLKKLETCISTYNLIC